ncbi:uncharacterized protein LOC132717825 [Ruditapes philippinarum]|uniref:uncharacterized protein LOC132717825 n=1 Tax=Ruditapes philippinarum TaxID=129788 RepID=UPI00295C059C|nr:uncharacterized protein LOC132717825 [Ruditapes philippinarum]
MGTMSSREEEIFNNAREEEIFNNAREEEIFNNAREEEIFNNAREEEIFNNDLDDNHIDTMQEDIEEDEFMAGFANLFIETNSSNEKEENKMDICFGFSDEFFTDNMEQENDLGQVAACALKNKQTNVINDSDSDSDIKFNLFGDSDDDDDRPTLVSNIKTLPGSILTNSDKHYGSQGSETKPKVNTRSTMFPQSSGLNQVNKGILGLSLSDSQLTKPEYTGPKPEDDDFCSICRDSHTNPKTLKKCSHSFCTDCIDEYFKIKPECPNCFVAYGVIKGNQPEGYMSDSISKVKLPGYEQYNTIVVSYGFSDGTQTSEHPNPGQQYHGTSRTAYLPNCPEGQKVLKLLKASFKRRLTFTIGRSRTTGCDNVVTWNDIHHKTSTSGGQENFGYPDPTYLTRVQQELAAKGVTEESVDENP